MRDQRDPHRLISPSRQFRTSCSSGGRELHAINVREPDTGLFKNIPILQDPGPATPSCIPLPLILLKLRTTVHQGDSLCDAILEGLQILPHSLGVYRIHTKSISVFVFPHILNCPSLNLYRHFPPVNQRNKPMSDSRKATVTRETKETSIRISINLDGSGISDLALGIPFLEHMLNQVARHGVMDLDIKAVGDLKIDAHHTVEDIGITLGQAFSQALGDKHGIRRYGHAYVPLDEALSRVVLDCSGRPGLEYQVSYPRARVGEFDIDLIAEFFQGFVNHAGVSLHIDTLRGRNTHHIAETIFKAFGRALRLAVELDPRMQGVLPSTKGAL